MASVVLVKEVEQGNTASYGASLPISATRVFEVTFDDWDYSNGLLACVASYGGISIPTAGNSFSGSITNLKAQAPQSRPKNGKSGRVFVVTVPYKSNDASIGGDKAISPLDRPVRYFSTGQGETREIDADAFGNLMVTSAQQVLTTNVPWNHMTIRATWNSATMVDYRSYFNTTNSAQVTINGIVCAIKTVYLPYISVDYAEEQYEGEIVEYYKNDAHFQIIIPRAGDDVVTWGLTIVDQGTVELNEESPRTQIPIVRNGVNITNPVKLDGFGDLPSNPANAPYFLDTSGADQIIWAETPSRGVEPFGAISWASLPPFV